MVSQRLFKSSFILVFTLSAILLIDGGIADSYAGDNTNSGTNYYAGLSCGQLWFERNKLFASKGYCFKSSRAIATFGRRCYAPYGKLPNHLRRVINEIKGWERHRRCR